MNRWRMGGKMKTQTSHQENARVQFLWTIDCSETSLSKIRPNDSSLELEMNTMYCIHKERTANDGLQLANYYLDLYEAEEGRWVVERIDCDTAYSMTGKSLNANVRISLD